MKVIRALVTTGRIDHEGQSYTFRDASCTHGPAARGITGHDRRLPIGPGCYGWRRGTPISRTAGWSIAAATRTTAATP